MTGLDLKLERVRLGLRQWRVAAELQIPPTVLWAIEAGRKPLTRERAEQIRNAMYCLALKTNADDQAA
jgi:hypothetical protein